MGTRLYVGNLPYSADEEQLKTLFSEGGRQVTEVRIVTDRDTGRPRGFAFVEMGSQADADAAVNALNGKDFGGRALTVNEAREQTPRRGGGFGGERTGRRRAAVLDERFPASIQPDFSCRSVPSAALPWFGHWVQGESPARDPFVAGARLRLRPDRPDLPHRFAPLIP